MVGTIYIKDKTRRLNSKYCQIREQIQLNYQEIQRNITHKFYKETTELDKTRKVLNKLIEKSFDFSIDPSGSYQENPIKIISSDKESKINCNERIDWTRGRFSGETIQIVVKNGQIMEKVFLTPKGNMITVKRHELGLLARNSIINYK